MKYDNDVYRECEGVDEKPSDAATSFANSHASDGTSIHASNQASNVPNVASGVDFNDSSATASFAKPADMLDMNPNQKPPDSGEHSGSELHDGDIDDSPLDMNSSVDMNGKPSHMKQDMNSRKSQDGIDAIHEVDSNPNDVYRDYEETEESPTPESPDMKPIEKKPSSDASFANPDMNDPEIPDLTDLSDSEDDDDHFENY